MDEDWTGVEQRVDNPNGNVGYSCHQARHRTSGKQRSLDEQCRNFLVILVNIELVVPNDESVDDDQKCPPQVQYIEGRENVREFLDIDLHEHQTDAADDRIYIREEWPLSLQFLDDTQHSVRELGHFANWCVGLLLLCALL